jgi:diguanylate cyclase (GGDEF)-like protein
LYAWTREKAAFDILAGTLFIGIIVLLFFVQRMTRQRSLMTLENEDDLEKINLLTVDIRKEEDFLHSLREKILKYLQLKGLTEKLSLCPSLQETTATLCREAGALFGKPLTVICYLFHSPTGALGISSSYKGGREENIKQKNGDFFDQWVVKTVQPLLVEDTQSDYRFDSERLSAEEKREARSLVSSPLMVGRKSLGILRLDSPRPFDFTTEDLRFLNTVTDLGALAIENARLHERLKDLAVKDGLTGLYLRRYLLDRLDDEISRETRSKKELSFLMVDLDHFKYYNDKFGHAAGDVVLKTVASILAQTFKKPGDLVARYGGEEFSVLLPDCPKPRALELARQFRKKIEDEVILLRREKTGITVSVGLAAFPQDARIKEEIISRADQALYQAKSKGRNRVCVA